MKRIQHSCIGSCAVFGLMLLWGSHALSVNAATPRYPGAGISLEFIGQGLVVSAAEVYQYGYFTHVAGVENPFGGSPENASTAFFTFFNVLSTTRVTDNGPVRIVDRKGTATIYLNPEGGASFADLDSFQEGTPILKAELRHQAILDTANGNTLVVNFDLTITEAKSFITASGEHRLGKPGQKMTWTATGRPNPAPNPGQFVYAGMGISHESPPPGLNLNRAGANTAEIEAGNAISARSRVESSSDMLNSAFASLDRIQPKMDLSDSAIRHAKFNRAMTE